MKIESDISIKTNCFPSFINHSSNTIPLKKNSNKTSPSHFIDQQMILYRLTNDKKTFYNNFNHHTLNTAHELPAGKFTLVKNAGTLTRQNTRINSDISTNISSGIIKNDEKPYIKQKTHDKTLKNGLTNVFLPKIRENEDTLLSSSNDYVTIVSLKEKNKQRKKRLPTTVRLEAQLKEHYKKMNTLNNNNDNSSITIRKTIQLDQLLGSKSQRNTITFPKKTFIFKHDKVITEELQPYTTENTRLDTKTEDELREEDKLLEINKQKIRYNPPTKPKIKPNNIKKKDWRDQYRNRISNSYIFNCNHSKMAKTSRQIKSLENKISQTFEALTLEVNATIHDFSHKNNLY